mgnify:CR=1 FL=1
MKARREKRDGGFTLVELLAVITILILLAGGLVVSVGYFAKRAGQSRTRAILMMVEQGINSFHNDFGVYPPDFWDSCNAQFFRGSEVSGPNPFKKTLSDGTTFDPEYKFNINISYNFSSEILYYFLIERFKNPQANDAIYLPRKTPYVELPDYAVADVDNDGHPEIVDAWGNPILYVAKDLYPDNPYLESADFQGNPEPVAGMNENSFCLYSYGNDGLGLYQDAGGTAIFPTQYINMSGNAATAVQDMRAKIDAKYGNLTNQIDRIKKANADNVINW